MPANINKPWFLDQLRARNETQASLARHLKVDRSQISLLLAGKRRLQMDMAERIANFLRVPVEEVIENAGIKINRRSGSDVPVRLVGALDENMVVKPSAKGDESCVASGVPSGAVAVRARTAGTAIDWIDGWTFFFEPSSGVDPSLIAELCVAEDVNGVRRIGNLRRGYDEGTYNMVTPAGRVENLFIKNATRVLQIRP